MDINRIDANITDTNIISTNRIHTGRNMRTGAVHRRSVRARTRTRVKSRPRFIAFLVIMIGLVVGSLGFATGMYDTTASVTTDYTSYTVGYGDTLWDIANEAYQGNTDTRKIVYAICQLNDIQAGDLQPGMILTIPTEL